jgi:hypothetical protein
MFYLGILLGWIVIGFFVGNLTIWIANYYSGGLFAYFDDMVKQGRVEKEKVDRIKEAFENERSLEIACVCLSIFLWPYLLIDNIFS